MIARTFFRLFILAAGLVLCARGLWLLFSPSQYQAVVRLEIDADIEVGSDGNTYSPYQPYFLETEFKVMTCDAVLSNVVQSLNLNAEWSQRYAKGGQLQTAQTIDLLRRHMTVESEPNSKLVDISVWDESPDEAARLANAVAQAYRDYRISQHRQKMSTAVAILQDDYQKEEAEIAALQEHLDQMRKQLVPTNPAPTDAMVMQVYNATQASLDPLKGQLPEQPALIKAGTTDVVRVAELGRLKKELAATNSNSADAKQMDRYDAYFQTKRELDDKEASHGLLKSRIQSYKLEEKKLDHAGMLDRLARIVVPAVPPKHPSAPGRGYGAVWLVCGLIISRGGLRALRSDRRPVKIKG